MPSAGTLLTKLAEVGLARIDLGFKRSTQGRTSISVTKQAVLVMKIEIGLGDCVGRKAAVRQTTAVVTLLCSADLTVDDDMSDMNATRAKLPRHAFAPARAERTWEMRDWRNWRFSAVTL